VTIPNSVTSIGDEAFVDCTILTSAVFQGNAPTMGTSVFVGCANGFTVDFYNGATGFTSPTWRDGNGSGNVYPAVNLGTLPDNSVATDTPTMPPWALVTLAMLLIATGSQFLPKPAVGIKF
jgi:hypothetical protein